MSSGRSGVRLFWLFFALYALTASGNAFRVPDEFEVYFQAEHLADAGDISVPQTLAVRENGAPIFFGELGHDGRPYAPYGPGVAFLILPFHYAGRLAAAAAGMRRAPLPGGIAWEFVVGGLTSLAMACAAALAVAGCYRACRALGAAEAHAVRLAFVLGACTILWPYGKTLYCEAWLAAAFVWAAALLLEVSPVDSAPRPKIASPKIVRKVGIAAALLALGIVTKPTAVVIAPAFVIGVLLEPGVDRAARWRTIVVLGAAIAAGALVQAGWNVFRFGRPLDFGYNLAGMIPYPPPRPFIPEQIPRGFFVQLLTPGKSLFLWAPATLLGLLALRSCWGRQRGLCAGLIVALLSALVFYAAFFLPEGGYSHGPRHLVPLVPLLMLPLAVPGVEVPRRALAAAAAAGLAMAVLAVTVSFFEDQSAIQLGARTVSPYYERVEPGVGEPNLRYRDDYVPFKFALTSGHWWSEARAAGNGPDFFALHLVQARRTLPGGGAIPAWLPWAVSLPWVAVLVVAALSLRRADGSGHKDHQDHEDHKEDRQSGM
jgi:hypothetical protein